MSEPSPQMHSHSSAQNNVEVPAVSNLKAPEVQSSLVTPRTIGNFDLQDMALVSKSNVRPQSITSLAYALPSRYIPF
jgi:hypothetical protein